MGKYSVVVALVIIGLGASALAIFPPAPRIDSAAHIQPPPGVIDLSDQPARPRSVPTDGTRPEQDYATPGWLNARITNCAGAADGAWCRSNATSVPDEIVTAMRGDYGGIRNVSYCLQTGCDGAMVPNRVTGCAWRLLALAHPRADDSDRTNWRLLCADRLGERDALTATLQALSLYQSVFGKDIALPQIKRLIPRN